MSYPPSTPSHEFLPTPSTPPPGLPPVGYPPANPNQTPMLLAVASLVTGVSGLLNCACCLFLPMPFISITLGAIALTQRPDRSARIMATIGIALSGLTLLVFFGSMVYFMVNPTSAKSPLIQP
jgi:hypothetical protein